MPNKLAITFYGAFVVLMCCVQSAVGQHEIQHLEPEAYFDFWVGEWEVSWDEANGQTGRGINRVEKTLDGTVVQEHFRITEGQNEGFKGTSISVYQPAKMQWKQAWADNNGGYYDFTGKTDGEKRIFHTKPVEVNGNKLIRRMVFYDITASSMTWDWEASQDGGENWSLLWRIYYQRLE